jgi:DNA-directed RNA polymerase sigma subunit (sigma70/sigma32)
MKDYRIELKVKNNHIASLIEHHGYRSVAEFCKVNGLQPSTVGLYMNLKKSPMRQDGNYSLAASAIATALNVTPEYLWPNEMLSVLEQNTATVQLDLDDVAAISGGSSPEQSMIDSDLKEMLNHTVGCLHWNQATALRLRFGLEGEYEHTLKEAGKRMGLSTNRVRQLQEAALKNLRKPSPHNSAIKNQIKE